MNKNDEKQKQDFTREEKTTVPKSMELDDDELEQVTGGYIVPNADKNKKR